jgi:hypothetical protein
MTSTKAALADLRAPGVWSQPQLLALDRAFTKLGEILQGSLLLRGKRATTEGALGATLSCRVECPFRPKTVLVLCATGGDGTRMMFPPITWSWEAQERTGYVVFEDASGLMSSVIAGPTVTFDVFMEKS